MNLKLLGIARALNYSPGRHEANDRLILQKTAEVLGRRGCDVRIVTEEELAEGQAELHHDEVVFSMCQGPRATERLLPYEDRGHLILNSPRAVQNCYRGNFVTVLRGRSSLIPATTHVVFGRELPRPRLSFESGRSYWVKRGCVHSTGDGDVVRVRTATELHETMSSMKERGIKSAVVQEHVDGTLVKFYGVMDTDFFRCYAHEEPELSPPEVSAARPAIEGLVRRLGLEIYGGDAVVTDEGKVHVIDINDWPSFARFRNEAAEAIGLHVFRRAVAPARSRAAVLAE